MLLSKTPYGKVREVKATDGSQTVSYRYDAAGNRIEKRIRSLSSGEGRGEVTHYLRDASGNVMAIYQNDVMIEQPLYGSSRLGMYKGGRKEGQRLLGKKNYELTNHLGNVLTVITDNAGMTQTSQYNGMDNNTWATVVSTTDYYPFGLPMKDRSFSDDMYRYGFNGKEKDNSISSTANYDYGFRIYDPRIGKFLSVDPLTKSYPWYTPYQFAGNKPIAAVDLDGLEDVIRINYRTSAGGVVARTSIVLPNSKDIKFEFEKIFLDLSDGIEIGGETNRFTNTNGFWLQGYDDYSKGNLARKRISDDIIPSGELTINVHRDDISGKDFYNFSYSKTITEDASYKSAVTERNFGTAYDLAKGAQGFGNWTAAIGLGVTATVIGSEVGVPLMAVGNSLSLGGDAAEFVIDLFHRDIKEAIITIGSDIPDAVFNFAAKKTGLGKAYPTVRESISTAIGLGANAVANKATAEQVKPSAKEIKKSNESELKSIGN